MTSQLGNSSDKPFIDFKASVSTGSDEKSLRSVISSSRVVFGSFHSVYFLATNTCECSRGALLDDVALFNAIGKMELFVLRRRLGTGKVTLGDIPDELNNCTY